MAEAKKKNPTKGMHEVEFVKDHGSYSKGDKQVYHASTASTLAEKGILKINKEIKDWKGKGMK